ncbi:MAG: hypothetical protein ACR2K5_10750, partial [Pseudolabrys sp.]
GEVVLRGFGAAKIPNVERALFCSEAFHAALRRDKKQKRRGRHPRRLVLKFRAPAYFLAFS